MTIRSFLRRKYLRVPVFGIIVMLIAALLVSCLESGRPERSQESSEVQNDVQLPGDEAVQTATITPKSTATIPIEISVSAETATAAPTTNSQLTSDSEPAPTLAGTTIVQLPLTMNSPPTDTPQSEEIEPSPTAGVELPPKTDYPIYGGPVIDRGKVGVQVHIHREDQDKIFDQLTELGAGWVKVQVSWKIYEPQPGQFDDFRLEELDRFINQANERDIQVLLGVAKAPDWSRPTAELDGPPSDPIHFSRFMAWLAERYRGKVAAYELWNEPNLNREWNGFELNAADLIDLTRAGAQGVRRADPEAVLISAAPAPTGINDGVNAIDDRQYLRSMAANGLSGVVDAVGLHPYGWANPADSSWNDPEQSAPSHNNHPSFFYADTISDYNQILDEYGMSSFSLWATEFGWGSYEGLGASPAAGAEYMAYVNEWQQAEYTLQAYQLAHEWGIEGPLILWNLNFGPTFGSQFVESSYSLLRPDGTKRPVFKAIAAVPKED